MSNTSTIYVYLIHYKVVKLIKGDFIMGIAYHKKTSTKYVQYTLRIEESILDKIKSIAGKEDLSINEVVNQSLQFAINDYEKNIFICNGIGTDVRVMRGFLDRISQMSYLGGSSNIYIRGSTCLI